MSNIEELVKANKRINELSLEIHNLGNKHQNFSDTNKAEIVKGIKIVMASEAVSADLPTAKKSFDKIAIVEKIYQEAEEIAKAHLTDKYETENVSKFSMFSLKCSLRKTLEIELEKKFSSEEETV